MSFLRLYHRVVALLAPERGLAITLTLANAALAAGGFLGPLLFGSIVDTLASSSARGRHEIWQQILLLLGLWGLTGGAASAPAFWSPCTPTGWRNAVAWRR